MATMAAAARLTTGDQFTIINDRGPQVCRALEKLIGDGMVNRIAMRGTCRACAIRAT